MYHQFSAAGETKEVISPEVTLDNIQERPDFVEKFQAKDNALLWEIVDASMPMIEGWANNQNDSEDKKDMLGDLRYELRKHLEHIDITRKDEKDEEKIVPLKAHVYGFLRYRAWQKNEKTNIKRDEEISMGEFVPEKSQRDTTQDSSEWKNKTTKDVFNEISPDEDTLVEPGVNIEELIINERHVEEIKEMVADKFGEEGLRIFELIVDDRMGVNEANRALNEELKTRIAPSTFKYQWGIIKEYVKTFLKDMGFAIKEKKQIPATV